MKYQYFVTPHFEPQVNGIFTHADAKAACEAFQKILNHYAAHGWEYVRTEEVQATVNVGCIGALFGQRDHTTGYKQLVFRRQVPATAQATPAHSLEPSEGRRVPNPLDRQT